MLKTKQQIIVFFNNFFIIILDPKIDYGNYLNIL